MPAAVYAAVAREIASATLVLRDVVWEVLHELYVTERFLMRDEVNSSRLEMCSLGRWISLKVCFRFSDGGYETHAATLLWSGVMVTVSELTLSQSSMAFNAVGVVDPVPYLKPWIAVTWAVSIPASL